MENKLKVKWLILGTALRRFAEGQEEIYVVDAIQQEIFNIGDYELNALKKLYESGMIQIWGYDV